MLSVMVLYRWKQQLHKWFFISCIALLLNNIGYLLELNAWTLESYLVAVKFSYLGRVWYALSLFLFVAKLTGKRLPKIFRNALILFSVVVYASILLTPENSLYYTDLSLAVDGIFPRLIHKNGILHHLNMSMQLFYIGIGLIWLIAARYREKNKLKRCQFNMIIFAILVESVCFGMKLVGIPGLTDMYDITMLGYFFGTIIMLIAIFSYELPGTEEFVREFIIDRLSEGVLAVDKEDRIQYFNLQAKELYPELGVDSAFDAEVLTSIRRSIKEESNIVIGEHIYLPEENALLSGGECVGTVYTLVDNTEHCQHMEELQKQKEIADSANETKSRFLANMSHEIRTPINAVLGFNEMILRESTEKAIRTYALDIQASGRTLLALINDILDFSKVEENKMELVPVQYELSSLINDLSSMVQDWTVKKGLHFTVNVDEHIPHLLYGDEIRIRQCVLNLLTNAVKYTRKGEVVLGVFFEKKDDTHILLGFTVEDTGIGMKQEDINKLFSPYRRIEEKRNRAVEGTGLGMSIVRQLLELMGSKLSVKSKYGKGTIVSFSVEQEVVKWEEIGSCAERFNEIRNAEYTYHELFHAPGARILVVDDTEMNLTVMASLLKKTQIHIDTALSGKKAIALTGENQYDVIFVDHMMPDMDGMETLRYIRESGKNTDTPVVALTANAISGARKMYLNAGFTDYLSKPVDGGRLERMLKSLIPEDKIEHTDDRAMGMVKKEKQKNARILVVDDDEIVCGLVKSIMEPNFEVKECFLGADARNVAREYQPDLIMLDIYLSDGNGFDVIQELKSDELTAGIPILMITGDDNAETERNGLKRGASDYIKKPFTPDVLRQRAKRIIEQRHYQRSIEEEMERQAKRSRRLGREIMLTLSKAVDVKDHYTNGHSRRVAALCAEIGRRLGKNDTEQMSLYDAGLLHDIGKIGIHEDIIHKNSRLSEVEVAEVREHTVNGYEILKEVKDMPNLCEGARWHHEHYDGTGYPDGLKETEIPETARIVCVADCYDAMTSTRTYSVPKGQEEVRAEIERCRGTWFDPQIADVILDMIHEDKEYRLNENASAKDVWREYDRLWGSANVLETENVSEDTSEDTEQSEEKLPEWLLELSSLDTQKGLMNCGSVEGYLSVLSVFHQTAASKAEEIERLYQNKDISGYTVKVHALKSSARIIGALELSLLAEKLENAGKENDVEFIKRNTGSLLLLYRELDKKFSAFDARDRELPIMETTAIREVYRTTYELAQRMEYELVEKTIRNLHGYKLEKQDEDRILQIERYLTELDWDGIAEVAKASLETMAKA